MCSPLDLALDHLGEGPCPLGQGPRLTVEADVYQPTRFRRARGTEEAASGGYSTVQPMWPMPVE